MKILAAIALVCVGIAMSGCAGDVARPVSVQALSEQHKMMLRVADVSAETKSGVVMTPMDLDRISERVKAELAALTPSAIVPANGPADASTARMKLVFTRYDRGSAAARALLIGLGQIRIDADVILIDGGGNTVGQYQVAKQFALGGLVGAVTTPADVEEGFAKSVAEIFRGK
jgi:uncharacterized protein DUF4410